MKGGQERLSEVEIYNLSVEEWKNQLRRRSWKCMRREWKGAFWSPQGPERWQRCLNLSKKGREWYETWLEEPDHSERGLHYNNVGFYSKCNRNWWEYFKVGSCMICVLLYKEVFMAPVWRTQNRKARMRGRIVHMLLW